MTDILRRDCGARMATGGGPVFQQLADLIKTKKSRGLPLLQQIYSDDDGMILISCFMSECAGS